MKTAVDSSVLLDVLGADTTFGPASREALRAAFDRGALVACEVVWAEVRAHFDDEATFDEAVAALGLTFSALSRRPLGWRARSGGATTPSAHDPERASSLTS